MIAANKTTLTNGRVTVANPLVHPQTSIFTSSMDANVTGALRVEMTDGVGFDIVSNNPADSGWVAYFIFGEYQS